MTNKKRISGLHKMNIEQQLDLLNSIFESSTEYSVIALDLDTTILAWNAGAQRIYGYPPEEVLGKPLSIILPQSYQEKGTIKDILKYVDKHGEWTGESERVNKDGSHLSVLTTLTLRKNAKNEAEGYTAISRDITSMNHMLQLLNKLEASERSLQLNNKKMEDMVRLAEEANKVKGEFLANVSHELRTPLNGIIGFAEMLYDGLVDPTSPKFKESLNDIITSANLLLTLINDVLDLSKIEAGKMQFYPVKTNLTEILEETRDIFQAHILEKNIYFSIQVEPGLEELIIDPQRLKQILYNFISNAIKFSSPGKEIIVRACLQGKKRFCLEVEDQGIGIRTEDLDKLFVKFSQVHSGMHKTFQGTGLGLALTKEIVEAQGGEIGVHSTYGVGSTFYACLPCYPYHTAERHTTKAIETIPEEGKGIKPTTKVPTILVLEKDSQERNRMVQSLIEKGFTVLAADSVKSALDQFYDYDFDVVILDLFLPEMGSWRLLRKLRAKQTLNAIPPIIVTSILEQPITLGFKINHFLTKPIDQMALLAALESIKPADVLLKTVLIIDNDQESISQIEQILKPHGYKLINKTNKVSALLALEQERADAVLFDPFMSNIDGLEFLRFYRQTQKGLYTPLIIMTKYELNEEERAQLRTSIQRVILRGEDWQKNLLERLEPYLHK